MSGIVGVFGTRATDPTLASSMASASLTRGSADHTEVRHDRASFLGVTRMEWEFGPDFSGPVLLVEEGELTIAADASLYYLDDLRRALAAAGVRPAGVTPSHLILAAYRAWGTACVDRLEGDFTFVIWNRLSDEVFCARDFVGRRPLYFAELNGTLVLGSTMGSVLAHPACSEELNPAAIGGLASGMIWSAGLDTCYRDIQVLQAAHSLRWQPGSAAKMVRFWEPHIRDNSPVANFDDAAEELRGLLIRATTERMASSGPTAIWMSGGWDSTSVFGAGRQGLETAGRGTQRLLPVSISYPEGDPGHEDNYIKAVAERWKSPVHWLQIGNIPLLDGIEERAAASDQPLPHLYEPINRALAMGGRALGARVCLDGNGGDQLFQVTDIYMSDLLKQGRLLQLRREWKAKRRMGLRYLTRMTVEPLLPAPLARAIAPVTRSEGMNYLQRPVPSWFSGSWVKQQGLVERDRALLPLKAWRHADAETRFFCSAPFWSYISSYMTGALLSEGVETRGPLMDRRLVEFGLRRPPEERAAGIEIKRLLRRSMTGLIPESVLAPRPYKTGLTVGYSRREMRAHLPALFDSVLSGPIALADLGAVDPARLSAAVKRYLDGDESERLELYHTLNIELWLRHRTNRRNPLQPVVREPLAATA